MKPIFRMTVAMLSLSLAAFCSAQRLSKISLAVPVVAGGVGTTATLELTSKVVKDPLVVTLSSSLPSVTVPANITIAAGASTATFPVGSLAVADNVSGVIKATLGSANVTTSLRLEAPHVAEFTFIPTSVQGGSGSTATVKISSAAPVGGLKVHLPSTTPAWGGPETVLVPAGATATSFSFTTVAVGSKLDATVSAFTVGDHIPAILTLTPPLLTTFTLSPTNVLGGTPSTGTLKLNGVAPKEGVKVNLSSDSGDLKFPEVVSIPSGETTATFTIATKAVTGRTPVRIIARAPAASIELVLTIVLPAIETFSLNSTTAMGGTTVTGTITLTGPAPRGGLVVNLSSSQSIAKLSSTITVPAGENSFAFPINIAAVSLSGNTTISASTADTKPQNVTLMVTPASAPKKSSGGKL